MKTKRMLSVFCLALFGVLAVLAKDIKIVTFNVPQMHCVNCEKKVKENIRFEKGVKEIQTNVENKTVTITYDADKTTVENLIKGFKKIKYDVTCADTESCAKGKEGEGCCTKGK